MNVPAPNDLMSNDLMSNPDPQSQSQSQSQPQSHKKPKEDRIYVKSNKKSGKKIELKNLDLIKEIETSDELDKWTRDKLLNIKNSTFKNNVFDCEKKQIVSSVRLIKTSKLGRKLTPMVWEYYKNRANLDINQVIKQYGRENLIINYSMQSQPNQKKIILDDNIILDKNVISGNI